MAHLSCCTLGDASDTLLISSSSEDGCSVVLLASKELGGVNSKDNISQEYVVSISATTASPPTGDIRLFTLIVGAAQGVHRDLGILTTLAVVPGTCKLSKHPALLVAGSKTVVSWRDNVLFSSPEDEALSQASARGRGQLEWVYCRPRRHQRLLLLLFLITGEHFSRLPRVG